MDKLQHRGRKIVAKLIVPKLGTIIPNMRHSNTTILDSILSKARRQVLGLLYMCPDKSFYTNEIIKHSHSGRGAIQRELENLTKAGLVTLELLGNQKRYQANKLSPIYSELRSIVLKTFGLADIIRQALTPVEEKIIFSFIYGSIAKQQDKSQSDIDLMIISNSLSYAELFPLLEQPQVLLGRMINPTFYSKKEWNDKKKNENNFITQVTKQPKIFLIGIEDEFKQLG